MQGDILQQATVFLAATLVSVPIAKKLGFGSIIGYLVAGVIIGHLFWVLLEKKEKI
jgi:Kef-type K+ transport system membrane component KefB